MYNGYTLGVHSINVHTDMRLALNSSHACMLAACVLTVHVHLVKIILYKNHLLTTPMKELMNSPSYITEWLLCMLAVCECHSAV